jgi:hypothetical protein
MVAIIHLHVDPAFCSEWWSSITTNPDDLRWIGEFVKFSYNCTQKISYLALVQWEHSNISVSPSMHY